MLICEGCTNICHVFIIFCDIFFILLHYIDKLADAIVIFDTGFRNLSKLLNMTEIGTAYTDEQSLLLHFLVCMLKVVVIQTVHPRAEGMSSQQRNCRKYQGFRQYMQVSESLVLY